MSELYGDMVRRLRKARGWSQPRLAEESGVKLRTLQDIEGNKHPTVQRGNRLALNAALDVPGDPEAEAESLDDDVKLMLKIVGAGLMTMTPTERLEWLHDFTISRMNPAGM